MNNLVKAIEAFTAAYDGDPKGLASDFALLTGHTIQEMTDLLQAEADVMNSWTED